MPAPAPATRALFFHSGKSENPPSSPLPFKRLIRIVKPYKLKSSGWCCASCLSSSSVPAKKGWQRFNILCCVHPFCVGNYDASAEPREVCLLKQRVNSWSVLQNLRKTLASRLEPNWVSTFTCTVRWVTRALIKRNKNMSELFRKRLTATTRGVCESASGHDMQHNQETPPNRTTKEHNNGSKHQKILTKNEGSHGRQSVLAQFVFARVRPKHHLHTPA